MMAATETAGSRTSYAACVPSFHSALPYGRSLADKAEELYRHATGTVLLDWQHDVLADWSAVAPASVGAGLQFVHHRCGLCVPRQNGKTHVDVAWALYLALVLGYRVLWTEHKYTTILEMIDRFRRILGKRAHDPNAPKNGLNALVADVDNGTASEKYEFVGGGCIHFTTRTNASSLGSSYDVIFYDEAQALSEIQSQAITPTTNAAPHGNPQIIFTGTPPRPTDAGTIFTKQRRLAREGAGGSRCWCEYGTEDAKADVTDRAVWYATNPSLGIVTQEVSLENDLDVMGRDGFLQDCLGWWLPEREVASSALSSEDWSKCAVTDAEARGINGVTAYGVKFSPDGRTFWISAAIRPDDGDPYVELIDLGDAKAGTPGLAAWIAERRSKTACTLIDGKDGAPLVQRLRSLGMTHKGEVIECSPREAQAAASTMVDRVGNRQLRHPVSPALDESASGSVRRSIGHAGYGFGDGPNAQSGPLESAALALEAVLTTRRNPQRKARIG